MIKKVLKDINIDEQVVMDINDGDFALASDVVLKKEGEAGQVIYRTGNDGYANRRILDDSVLVCETQYDLDQCKFKSFATPWAVVCNTWPQFGNYDGKCYGYDQDYPVGSDGIGVGKWELVGGENRIRQTVNTKDFCGYVSDRRIRDYEAVVRFSAADGDDDMIGFVAAAAKDADGKMHTLSFVRTPNNQDAGRGVCDEDYHWFCILDGQDAFNPQTNVHDQVCLAHGTLNSTNEPSGGWNSVGKGTLVRVRRVGDKFFGWTTEFRNDGEDPAETDLGHAMVVDLDDCIRRYPAAADRLRLFAGTACRYGYCAQSIPKATFDVVRITNLGSQKPIVNLVRRVVEKYDAYAGEYFVAPETIGDVFKDGTFSYNDVTNKMFYSSGERILNVSTIDSKYVTYDLSTYGGIALAVQTLLLRLGVSEDNIIKITG